MRCTKCGTEGTLGRKFCKECGSPLSNQCAKCGADNSPSAKFCEDCGAGWGAPTVAAKKSDEPQIRVADTPASETLDGERKIISALFADIKGSTALMEEMDPEEARAIIDPALRIMIEAVKRYDGYSLPSDDKAVFGVELCLRDDLGYETHIVKLGLDREVGRDADNWKACTHGRETASRRLLLKFVLRLPQFKSADSPTPTSFIRIRRRQRTRFLMRRPSRFRSIKW